MLNIKVNPGYDDSAITGGHVYGLIDGEPDRRVYVELGEEDLDYCPRKKHELKEDRKLFRNCILWFATTQERLEKGIFEKMTHRGTVIIYK